jgi:hypothetical protein
MLIVVPVAGTVRLLKVTELPTTVPWTVLVTPPTVTDALASVKLVLPETRRLVIETAGDK